MTYRVPAHVSHRALHDEVVILDDRADAYLGLNRSAAVVWSVLAAGESPAAAVEALVGRFEVDPASAEADVAGLVADLLARGLIEPVSA